MAFYRNPTRRRATRDRAFGLESEGLEARRLLSADAAGTAPPPVLTPMEVSTLLDRAARATSSDAAIVAVVDREGNPLGVRVEGNVSPAITGSTEKLVFSIDGALAEARTGAFFASNAAPLTSRTIQNISQSTITQREVESDPNIPDPNSTVRGPGFVAPIGEKGHFPPRVSYTPQVDLFEIEHTNRDTVEGKRKRFNANPVFIPTVPTDQSIPAPESYGVLTGMLETARSRGIGTLPGGIPIFKGKTLVGGIGVFFPGTTGYATEENSSLNDAGFFNPKKPDLSQEAEYIAFVAAGGSKLAGASFNTPAVNAKLGLPPLDKSFDLPFGRIDLVGITLDLFGGHGLQGPRNLVSYGSRLGLGDVNSGLPNRPVNMSGQPLLGKTVPTGWIVVPHDSADGTLTASDVTGMIQRGIAEANRIRAAIRLPLDSTAKMIFAVTDNTGEVLGLYRMPDATYFSFDVAVAKARNVAYYANANELQPIDQVSNLPAGVAMTNRTFRYLAEPRFPEGIDGNRPGPFSILNESNIRETGPAKPASAFQTVQGYDAFNPATNFHDPNFPANQNGIVFFPGSAPLYKVINGKSQLVGGLGVSGDGVDQDDDVTFQAAVGFTPPTTVLRADQVFVRGVRLPYQKFNRQPHEPIGQTPSQPRSIKPLLPNGNQTGLTPRDVTRIERYRVHAIATAK